MNGYDLIVTQEDILRFDREANGLHDGYLLSVQFENGGIRVIPGGHSFDPEKTALSLRFLVTSIWDAVVELVFTGIREWQIRDDQQDIIDCGVSLAPEGLVIWAEDPVQRRNGSYVVADRMYWRIVK